MEKEQRSASQLRDMALLLIRAAPGCESLASVEIRAITDDRAGCNWSIFIDDLEDADGDLAHRAAIEAQSVLSESYDLEVV
jgi:hypothetical protein